MPLPFSSSQQHLIRLVAKGYPDSEIARRMALTPDQLQKAFSSLCTQVNVADRVQLILLIWSCYGSEKRKNKNIGASWNGCARRRDPQKKQRYPQ